MIESTVFDGTITCSCGKVHRSSLEFCVIENGALTRLASFVKQYGGKKVFLLSDVNTYPLAGDRIVSQLRENGIVCISHVFSDAHLEPDEHAVGSALMHFDSSCDCIVTLGSGVLNDIGKILASHMHLPYIVVATAPSMDGYASASSSMAMDGVKVSLPTTCPRVVIGDIDIVKQAPMHMLKSGIGDMLAKYVSLCEWRISHLITGEYYCEAIADYIRTILHTCIEASPGLMERNDDSVKTILEGLVACGCAMEYAGLSRPASGIEHYFSHLWDMRGLSFGEPVDLHGIQCAIGTRYALRAYEQILRITPDIHRAQTYVAGFDIDNWFDELRAFVGKGADAMIALEQKEGKYDPLKHKERITHIIQHWDDICSIIREELPSSAEFDAILKTLQMPETLSEIGLDEAILPMTFKASKDIRDKYVLSRLAWDLGIIDEIKL
ncbi:MAG: sn-glycerol-1-phosphate dehydrogenase [Ruminococcaceae bacterium]|nr:sn-glycerol-1-phosphate dehydrogenase [Oscillospiraceae bacterium]